MKILKIIWPSMIVMGLISSTAFSMHHTPGERGKMHFNDPKFAGGSNACASCHPDGKGLEKAADKKEFKIMGKAQKSLEEAVNFCIENANKGKAIDVKSEQMKDIVAYINSLKGKMMEKEMPMKEKKAPGY